MAFRPVPEAGTGGKGQREDRRSKRGGLGGKKKDRGVCSLSGHRAWGREGSTAREPVSLTPYTTGQDSVQVSEVWDLSEIACRRQGARRTQQRCHFPEHLGKTESSTVSVLPWRCILVLRDFLPIRPWLLNTESIHGSQDSPGCVYMMPEQPAK